jgi:GMP synthase-like glutamine amidotransferase
MMNIHSFHHVPFEGLGSISQWANNHGHSIRRTRLYDDSSLPSLKSMDWLIVMGGPMNVHDHHKFPWLEQEKKYIEQAILAGKVVLGVCLGAQLIANVLGAEVRRNEFKEIGWFLVQKTKEADRSLLCKVFPSEIVAFHWHGDTFDLPAGAIRLASSIACENQGFVYGDKVIRLQFHLEITKEGARQLVKHCAYEIVKGPCVQSAHAILADNERFNQINRTMWKLLDRLRDLSP